MNGLLSLSPIVLALTMAFITKDAIFALLVGCIVGVVIAGSDPATGLVDLFKNALGTPDFIWVMMIVVVVGVMIALYLRSGVIAAFGDWAQPRISTPRRATGFSWTVGLFVFFSDYFSPIFVGSIARPLTDRHRVSREMLAYLLDSGSAPICTLIPLSGWAVYIAGLLQGYGPVQSVDDGTALFIRAIPYNFYGWLALILAGLFAFGLLPHFGPMRRAERRARELGKVYRDGATPLAGKEMDGISPRHGARANLVLFLFLPVLIVLVVAISSFWITGKTKTLTAFFAALVYQSIAMAIGRHFRDVRDAVDVAMSGIKAVLPALVILALAYSIAAISKTLGADDFIVSMTAGWMTAGLLPLITFVTGAVISFFTGTSWGAYAILTPMVLPTAVALAGGTVDGVVPVTVGALVGGALFGDHCSPISDTTCLSSFGAAADHMDHVTTQLPYALTAAALSAIAFLALGYGLM